MNSNQQPGANDDSSIYTNHPLGARTTRVVHIISPEEYNATDTISLRLSVISMDPPSAYRAVSYVWGIPDVTETILVDGNPFCIRINLWHFLAQMCKEGYRGALWIDAICINQNDLEERSRQVAIMGEIYSQAQDVRAWLGVGTAQDWLGMERLIGTDWRSLTRPSILAVLEYEEDDDGGSSGSLFLPTQEEDDCIRQLLSVTTNEFLAPILGLLELPLWSRLWIVQEFFLARSLTIQCGGYFTTLYALYDCIECASAVQSSLDKITNIAGSASSRDSLDTQRPWWILVTAGRGRRYTAIWLITKKYSWHPKLGWDVIDFATLLLGLRSSECADFHDYIYAVRTLSAAAFARIIPDYTKSRLQLFLDVAAFLAIEYNHTRSYGRDIIHKATVSLHDILQLGWECEKVRKALAAVPDPGRIFKD